MLTSAIDNVHTASSARTNRTPHDESYLKLAISPFAGVGYGSGKFTPTQRLQYPTSIVALETSPLRGTTMQARVVSLSLFVLLRQDRLGVRENK